MMGAVYARLLRSVLTPGRLVAVATGGLAVVVVAGLARAGVVDPSGVIVGLVFIFGFWIFLPAVVLVFASAVLGDLAEDGTLVYLWLRPVPRWKVVASAAAAAASVSVTATVGPLLAAVVVVGGSGNEALATAVSGLVAGAAYTSVFVGLGLLTKRALLWGLLYVLIWEGPLAAAVSGPARVSVRLYSASLFAEISGLQPPRFAVSLLQAWLVPTVVTLLGLGLGTWILSRKSV